MGVHSNSPLPHCNCTATAIATNHHHLKNMNPNSDAPHCNGTATISRSSPIENMNPNSEDLTLKSAVRTTPSSDPNSLQPQMNDSKLKKKSKKRTSKAVATQNSPSSSSSASSSVVPNSSYRGLRLAAKRRNPRFLVHNRASDADIIAYPLGMSIAAVVAQILERKDATGEEVSVDHVSKICTSAVRESLANVFGNKFDSFTNNFEKSFGSTFNTIRLIRGSSVGKRDEHLSRLTFQNATVDPASSLSYTTEPSSKSFDAEPSSNCFDASYHHVEAGSTVRTPEQLSDVEEIHDSRPSNSMKLDLSLTEQRNRQLAVRSSNTGSSSNNYSLISTFEKSVSEQTRANDLKVHEIELTMRKLRLKESQLSLKSDSNILQRVKLSMGVSKASFKAEQFKNKLEDTRHAEFLTKCIDCLVAGLLIMSAALAYGAYVYSFKRLTDATNSCTPSTESNSWWIPKPVTSLNTGLQAVRCLVQVFSRMLFGIFMILSIAYLLIQRAATSRQTMPITFILLLLGLACGFAGKFCVDTLGGNGYSWLVYWEILCSLHFVANTFTAALFFVLYGRVGVTESKKGSVLFPFWIRRLVFFLSVLVVLPLLCGFLPFASFGEWRDHFLSLFRNLVLVIKEDDG